MNRQKTSDTDIDIGHISLEDCIFRRRRIICLNPLEDEKKPFHASSVQPVSPDISIDILQIIGAASSGCRLGFISAQLKGEALKQYHKGATICTCGSVHGWDKTLIETSTHPDHPTAPANTIR